MPSPHTGRAFEVGQGAGDAQNPMVAPRRETQFPAGIDARELCGRATGAGRYLDGLLRCWSGDESTSRRHEFVLYAPEPLAVAFDAHRFATRIVPGAPNTWWEQVRLPPIAARDHLDVFFAPAYTAPLAGRVPTVTAIHDVSFAAHPEWFSAREGLRRRTSIKWLKDGRFYLEKIPLVEKASNGRD